MNLVNAELRAATVPTFQIPNRERRERIRPGMFVKLIFDDKERMWVKVTAAAGARPVRYWGRIASTPVATPYQFDESVTFGPEHIIAIRACEVEPLGHAGE